MKIFVGVAALGVVAFVFREKWLLMIGDFLIIEDDLHPADVIHVIAGDDYRTEYAIQLYKQGYAKTLFFTGGWCTYHNYYHGKHAEELALSQGVPVDAIVYNDAMVTSTYMEAEKVKEWIGQRHLSIESIIVVSDPFHMRRARWAFKRVLGRSVQVQMAPVPFEVTPYQRSWWKDWRSRRSLGHEYLKIAYYILRYQISRGQLREWLISLDRE